MAFDHRQRPSRVERPKIVDVVVNAPSLSVDVELNLGFTEQVAVGSRAAAATAEKAVPVFPDRNSTVNSFNGIQTYPSQSPFGMNGRALYLRIGRTF